MKRTELREHIFKVLFGVEFNAEQEMPEQLQLYFEQLEDAREKDLDYIRTKSSKIAEKIAEIDSLINEHTTGWKTSRMNKVDLTILRLAVYEMKWDEDVPTGVAIDEAVELAKKYSSDEGPAFINAVLGKLAE
ncbi:transcription antitermination factor NusB [Faecalicatena contorta]|uniref:transcription antitermination factor NusB n=1 Tax=Lachnospiraceae TaxID=186803 RepID=UPI001F233DF0|nr:transcription antitermination factor NusB [Faecalicatena contorta]MCF2667065.1 transcription antitermination factor NusB [Faecalicatena contorta]MCI6121276.1 transcription antitermination factor NusB [Lachnospiraceae bacterium]MCI6535348.1 transcription antitermination factor NusB [Lachnospiraceae bacterium]MDY4206706.1 transcription antitermination factor NusB [Lachnospiraceae bacterium]